jgi:hypothetical protein
VKRDPSLEGFDFFLDKTFQMISIAVHSLTLAKGNSGTMFLIQPWQGFYFYFRGGPFMV